MAAILSLSFCLSFAAPDAAGLIPDTHSSQSRKYSGVPNAKYCIHRDLLADTFGHPVLSFQTGIGKYQMSVVSIRVERLAEWAINWPEEFNGANPAEPNSVIM